MPKDVADRPIPVAMDLHSTPMGFFESLRAARRNLLEIIPALAVKQPIISGKTGVRWHMVMDPGALRRILTERLDDYPKSDVTKRILRPAIGDSLFVAEGAHWRWQRRAASPVFAVRNIDNLAPIMSAVAKACADRLASKDGQVVDVYEETVRMTMEVIAEVTFSSGDSLDTEMVGEAVSQYIDRIAKISMLDMMGAPDWIPRPGRVFGPGSLKRVQNVASTAIAHRINHGAKETPDLLDLLMAAEDSETARSMTPMEVRDNLLAFITAGHETTALALAWALYLLAFDQDVQDRARAEAQSALDGAVAGAEHIPSLGYIRQIIHETMRLYPPAAFLSRTAMADDTLCDRHIRKGDTVMLPIYALHRHELLWDAPNAFDPDRFAEGTKIDRYAYLPFGNGPRICIGAEFALRESQIILATLLTRFRFTLSDRPPPQPHLLMTLRPKGGVHLNIEALSSTREKGLNTL